MNPINDYHIEQLNLSKLEEHIVEHGEMVRIRKNGYLITQNRKCDCVGFVSEGMFRHIRTDNQAKEHIVGYSFKHDFVGEYSSLLCRRESLITVQAITDSEVYVLHGDLNELWNSSDEWQLLGRRVAEQLFAMSYRRLIEFQCSTPEERYMEIMRHYPDLKESVSLKEIASYIGVTPETVSKIRRRLSKNS